jgi:hypothetical protein
MRPFYRTMCVAEVNTVLIRPKLWTASNFWIFDHLRSILDEKLILNECTPEMYSCLCTENSEKKLYGQVTSWGKVMLFRVKHYKRVQISSSKIWGLWISKGGFNVDFKNINLLYWQNAPKKKLLFCYAQKKRCGLMK